jgi:hypothetical protein
MAENLPYPEMITGSVRELWRKVDAGIKEGVASALEEHYRMRRPIVEGRDGRVVTVPPEEYKDAIESASPKGSAPCLQEAAPPL